jgi:hypothetical protein
MERDSINAPLAASSVGIAKKHSPEHFRCHLPELESGERTIGVTGVAARAAAFIYLANRKRAAVCSPGGGDFWYPAMSSSITQDGNLLV